jgi:hypothetical protein
MYFVGEENTVFMRVVAGVVIFLCFSSCLSFIGCTIDGQVGAAFVRSVRELIDK